MTIGELVDVKQRILQVGLVRFCRVESESVQLSVDIWTKTWDTYARITLAVGLIASMVRKTQAQPVRLNARPLKGQRQEVRLLALN